MGTEHGWTGYSGWEQEEGLGEVTIGGDVACRGFKCPWLEEFAGTLTPPPAFRSHPEYPVHHVNFDWKDN